ncbi:MAG: hypothetical protein WC450_06910 [Candidatus Omnitrophota bacterium]
MRNLHISIGLILALVLAGCTSAPKTFMRTHDEPGIWKTVEIREEMENDKIWEVLVDTLSQKYDLEVVERGSGYIRSSWKYSYFSGQKVIDRYRSRVVVKIKGTPVWDTVQVKCESNWLDNKGWILGYDTLLLEDIYGDIQGKLGRVRR